MRTGDTIEEPRVVITCRARLTGPHACTRVCTYTPLHQGRVPLSPFHRTPLRSPIIPPLSTCKPRVSTRSDPRPHLLSMNSLPPPPLQLMNAIIYLRTRPSSREQRGCNNVEREREREGRGSGLWMPTRVDGDNGRILVRLVEEEDIGRIGSGLNE